MRVDWFPNGRGDDGGIAFKGWLRYGGELTEASREEVYGPRDLRREAYLFRCSGGPHTMPHSQVTTPHDFLRMSLVEDNGLVLQSLNPILFQCVALQTNLTKRGAEDLRA